MLSHLDGAELREAGLEVLQLQCVGPVLAGGGTQHLENLEDLIDLGIAHKQRSPLHHLGKDAASGPKVNTESVGLLTEQNFGAAVPESNDFMGVGLDGESKSAGKTKVSQLDVLAHSVDEKVLGLEVAMEDSVLVEVDEGLENLVEEALGLLAREGLTALGAHVFLEIKLKVFKYQVELVLTVNDFFEPRGE